jgi:hypothetical protein
MKLALLAGFAALASACGHGDAELRNEHAQAQARQYRDAYETQAVEIAALKARVNRLEAELEKRDCR